MGTLTIIRGCMQVLTVSIYEIAELNDRQGLAWPTNVFCPARQNVSVQADFAEEPFDVKLFWTRPFGKKPK